MREQCVDGPRPMRDRVLLGHRHLREGLRRALRDEDRIEPESPGPALPLRDRAAALSVEDLVLLRRPEEEDGLEPRGAIPGTVQKLQDPGAPQALVYVRRIDAGETTELFEEQARVINQVVAANLTTFSRRSVWISGYVRSSCTSLMWASANLVETSRNLPSFVVTNAITCNDPATRSPSLSR